MLPERVAALLVVARATPRLVAHLRLVHDVASRLLDAFSHAWPELQVDRETILFGAATHDIGKILQPDELFQPGSAHEIEGRRMLVAQGIDDRLARFAETHGGWKRGDDCTFEDLIVALADTCWKGKRSEQLEEKICSQILTRITAERWEAFATLDAIVETLARHGDQRLAWQSRY
jgi:hypothetical protein